MTAGRPRAKRPRRAAATPPPPPDYDLALHALVRALPPRARPDPARRVAGGKFGPLAAAAACSAPPARSPVPTPPPAPAPPAPRSDPGAQLVRLTACDSAGAAVFLLRAPRGAAVAVAGGARLTVLRGAVGVLGYRATAAEGPVALHSAPLGPFLLTLAPAAAAPGAPADGVLPAEVQAALLERGPMGGGVLEAVVRLAPLAEEADVAAIAAPLLAHLPLPLAGLCSGRPELVPGLVLPSSDARPQPFRVWDNWPQATAALSEAPPPCPGDGGDGGDAAPLRLLTCGDAGSGKSMLARCAVNHLLAAHPSVIYVETDVGQPELTPPGLVSATEVRAPLLGPPASHNATPPLFASYFGEVTPREHAAGYAAAVAGVIVQARAVAAARRLPLVINSGGWVSGTGGELLHHVARVAAPTHVFATTFPAAAPRPSADGTAPGSAPRRAGGSTPPPPSPLADAVSSVLHAVPARQRAVLVAPHAAPSRPSVYPAPLLRDLSLSCYLAPALTGRTPVRSVSLRDVNVAFLGEAVPATHVLAALRGAVVALASTSGSPTPSAWAVAGLGVVRAVDAAELMLHVSTPVGDDALSTVDGLIASAGVAAPTAALLAVASADGDGRDGRDAPTAPYFVRGVLAGADAMRSRSTLPRR